MDVTLAYREKIIGLLWGVVMKQLGISLVLLSFALEVEASYQMPWLIQSGEVKPQLRIVKRKKCAPCEMYKQGKLPFKHNKRVTQKYSKQKQEQRISVDTLNRLLANTMVLLTQTLHYHWNLRGPEFNDYHGLLDEHYERLFDDLDLIAERVRAVGGNALGSMQQMLKHATLREDDCKKIPDPRQMITNLHQQYQYHIEDLRDSISMLDRKTHDYGSKKMLEDLIEQYEKTAWMLRSLLGYQ